MKLGLSLRLPFLDSAVTVNLSVLFSLLAATSLRCIEAVAAGFYPGLPRFMVIKKLYQFFVHSQQSEEASGASIKTANKSN